ncbi:Peroxisomal membrane protein PEX16, partial [Stegodyphus mimosarum]
MATTLVNYLDNYKYFVTKNPLLANEIEVALKWMSYIAAGRFSRSTVVTELIHSVSNLLALVNDNILRKAAGIPVHVNVAVEKLQTLLAVIEYSEVFAEVAARRISGSRGKWLVIASVQFVKTVIRILLILKYDQGLQHSPPIKPLNRRCDLPQLCEGDGNPNAAANFSKNVEVTFKLKRSGRAVRTLDTAPPLVSRTWKLPKEDESMQLNRLPSKLTEEYLAGEILHVCRPLVH